VEHGAPHATIADLLWPALNFLLFAALLARALRGPIREYFRERAERLRDGLEAGRRAQREAEALRAEIERDIAGLPALRERLKADLRAAAEQQRNALIEGARRVADRLRNDARVLADQEAASARVALKGEVVGEAVREAMALVRAAARPEDQERFVRDFVQAAGTVP